LGEHSRYGEQWGAGSCTLFVIGRIKVVDPHRPWRRPQSHAGRTTICEFNTGALERPLDRVTHGTMNGFFVLEIMDDSDINAGRDRYSSLIPIEQAARGPALCWYHGNILTTIRRSGHDGQSVGETNDDADHDGRRPERDLRLIPDRPLARLTYLEALGPSQTTPFDARAIIGKMDTFVDNLRSDLVPKVERIAKDTAVRSGFWLLQERRSRGVLSK
jgi:hypothetical protein